ncbi:hypothetical protein THRCLA_07682 [Thraustotheca clavata]|uniref:RanBP2-type domain-containing protein n=1 Tax=Thraustotheca clavata TaxID=74557 RepID=A0A1V9ZCC8_9STRA|nr:hypothetical protein THRCLA_07682 [Thraustotheca clavata]
MERRNERTKEWECSVCTLLNGYQRKTCAACLNERAENSLELFSQLSQPPPQVAIKRRRLKLSMPAAPMLSQADMMFTSQNGENNDMIEEKNEDLIATKATRMKKLTPLQVLRDIDEDELEEKASTSKSSSPVKGVAKSVKSRNTKMPKLKAVNEEVKLSQTPISFNTIPSSVSATASLEPASNLFKTSQLLDGSIPSGCLYYEAISPTKYPRLRRTQRDEPILKAAAPITSVTNQITHSLLFKTPGSPQTAADLMGRWISPQQHFKETVNTKASQNDEIEQNSVDYERPILQATTEETTKYPEVNFTDLNHSSAQEPTAENIIDQVTRSPQKDDTPVVIKREILPKLALPDEVEPPSFQLLNLGLPAPSQEPEPQFNLLGNLPLLSSNQDIPPEAPLETPIRPSTQPPKLPLALPKYSQEDSVPSSPYNKISTLSAGNDNQLFEYTNNDWHDENNKGRIQHENTTSLDWNDEVIEDSDTSPPPKALLQSSQRKSFFDIDVTDSKPTKPRKSSIIDATDSPEPLVSKKRIRTSYDDDSPDSKMRKVGLLDDSEALSEEDVVVVPRRLRRPAIAESPPSSPESIQAQGWACQQCTYMNENEASNSCEMCGQSKKSTVSTLEEIQVFDEGPWTCNVCTNLNKKDPQRCELCDTPRDKDGTSQIDLMDSVNDDEGMFNFYEANSGDEAEVVDLTKKAPPKYDSDSIEEISDYEPISTTTSSSSIPQQLQEFSHFIPVSCLQAKSTLKEPGIDYLNMFANRGGKNYADRRKKRLIESRKRTEDAQKNPSGSFGFASASGSKSKKSKAKVPSFQSAKAAFHSKSRKRKGKTTSNSDAWKSRSNKTPSLQAAAATSDAWRSRPANNGPVLLSGTTLLPKKKTQSMRVVDDGGQFDNIGFQPARRHQYASAPVEFNQGDLAMWEGKGSLNFGR